MNGKYFDLWLGIGLNIMYYRKEQGLTQMQLAEMCNISKNHIHRVENAASGCSVEVLSEIAEALNIPIKKLFEFRD